ncbi:MAG: molybdopterin-dependent oxidoreductase, partial [Chloroflexia bacterium]|nr:molybdopterin-dependent oxidoreductase [Chloroflexia bacterium]
PALLKFADGVQRHGNGGQTARALACLATITGQVGLRGGGLGYSTGGYVSWDRETVGRASQCPPTPRTVNMNRLGAALCGEVEGPPIRSLYVFCANPAAASPNTAKIIEGLRRDDLFTVVHEQFLTDTADYADLVLPATTQLEQVDLHTAYGHRNLQYNARAIDPPGEARSNLDVMRTLAAAMGYDEPWFRQEPEEIIAEVLAATARANPLLAGVTLDRLQRDGTVPLAFGEGDATVPFADGHFPTPSGKVELYCEAMADNGLDPLPRWEAPAEFAPAAVAPDGGLTLISGASHHFVTTSMANQPGLEAKEGSAHVEIHPEDAVRRGIIDGADVVVENRRGSCQLRAVVTDDVPVGVVVAPKGRWGKRSGDGRSINWTTPDALADLAGQSTFHDNIVWIRPGA